MAKRAIIIVLDSVGIGELPDAADYGDAGSNTLLNIKARRPDMELPHMNRLGLCHIDGASALGYVKDPVGAFCKLAEVSKGKDTTTGHWEIAGINLTEAPPTYPEGFPQEIIAEFEERIGRKSIGNIVSSGTGIIAEMGDEHVSTGYPVVYTSADSVFQIAMHENVIPLEEQRRISRIAREILKAPHNVSRVIMRPFVGESGNYTRTSNRRDFSLEPIGTTMLDCLKSAGLAVAAVGKIEDIFAGRGITRAVHIDGNMDGVDKTLEYMENVPNGLIFTNLVDFDMIYGHRNDVDGYADALMAFDRRVPEILNLLRDGDTLFITADHGCDPTTPSTDHSREYIPLLVYGKHIRPGVNLHIRDTFSDIAATVLDYLAVKGEINGCSFLKEVIL
ncbi:MAG: phosphopentomutase [Clostridiales bacterium]|jgi:phosphopentomutase|nr:phosphopentomutase [Clostridiales bacterium]